MCNCNRASAEKDSGIHRTGGKHFGIVQRADFNDLTPQTLSATRNSGRFTERKTALWHEIFDNRTRTQGNDDCDLQSVYGKQAENPVLDGSGERLCRARIRLCSRIETCPQHVCTLELARRARIRLCSRIETRHFVPSARQNVSSTDSSVLED